MGDRLKGTRKQLTLDVGLGEAIMRFTELQKRYAAGLDQDGAFAAEREMLREALNSVRVKLPIVCLPGQEPRDLDGDGSISFFEAAVTTDCCHFDPDRELKKRRARRATVVAG